MPCSGFVNAWIETGLLADGSVGHPGGNSLDFNLCPSLLVIRSSISLRVIEASDIFLCDSSRCLLTLELALFLLMSTDKVVATNREAYHNFHILETHECGVALTGTEV